MTTPTPLPTSKRLIDLAAFAAKIGCSRSHALRLADSGKAPWGFKLGRLRRWDEGELDTWISSGCKPVRNGGTR